MTEYDITPQIPTDASARPSRPKAPNSVAIIREGQEGS